MYMCAQVCALHMAHVCVCVCVCACAYAALVKAAHVCVCVCVYTIARGMHAYSYDRACAYVVHAHVHSARACAYGCIGMQLAECS